MREDHRATTRTALLSTCLTKGLMQGWGVATFHQNGVPSSLTIHSHSVLTPHPNLWPMRLKSRHCFLDETLERPSPLTLAGLEQPLVNCEAGPGLVPRGAVGLDCALENQVLEASGTKKQGRTVGVPENAVCTPGPLDTSRHDGLFFSVRLNYIEGTKMLAAYLYEVSQLEK